MSRVYFHSLSGEAELRGSERAWLGGLVDNLTQGVLDIRSGSWHVEALRRFLNPAGPVPVPPTAGSGFDEWQRWYQTAEMYLVHGSIFGGRHPLIYQGKPIDMFELALNTAMTVGNDAVRLAARIHAQCEIHGYVEGPNRGWLADLMQTGLDLGVFRPGLWYVDRPCGGQAALEPDRKWSDQGWGDVMALLRSRDDEPVVMSYSVCDQFPDRDITDWRPTPMPDGYAPSWANTDEGHAEWERDYPTPEDKAAHYREHAREQWYDLPAEEQWRWGMEALRRDPERLLELRPDNFATARFGHELSYLDLFAHDADERVARAFAVPETADA